jgi:NAD(P)H-dependent FMN reductase
VTAVPYEGLAGLPAFNPDHDGERVPEAVAELRREIAAADAVLFCTPEYAGSLPGSLKNLLDWTVAAVRCTGKPVAWISVAAEGRGMGAQDALASMLGYLGATVIETARRRIPVARAAIGPDGIVADPRFQAQVAELWPALLDHISDRWLTRPLMQKRAPAGDAGPVQPRADGPVRSP